MDPEVLFVYRLIPTKSSFREYIVIFDTTPVRRYLKASFSVHGGIGYKSACFWVSVNIQTLYHGACEIGRWVVHVDSEK
jgi:hypothetical protein